MAKKLTVTVGISALNEEANIQKVLRAVLAQDTPNYELTQIIVVSDGSTDTTAAKAREIGDRRIVLIEHQQRKGKVQSLNEIFTRATSDVVVVLDADLVPADALTISELIKPFLVARCVGYVGGKLVPLPSETFVEQCVQVGRKVWDKLRDTLEEGNSVYSCSGGIYAVASDFAKQALFPQSVWVDTGYYYFACQEKGYKFLSNKKARALFRVPATVADHVKQISRYVSENEALDKVFSPEMTAKAYAVPKRLLYRYKLEVFLAYPVHCLVLLVLNAYAKAIKQKKYTGLWQMVESTKVRS